MKRARGSLALTIGFGLAIGAIGASCSSFTEQPATADAASDGNVGADGGSDSGGPNGIIDDTFETGSGTCALWTAGQGANAATTPGVGRTGGACHVCSTRQDGFIGQKPVLAASGTYQLSAFAKRSSPSGGTIEIGAELYLYDAAGTVQPTTVGRVSLGDDQFHVISAVTTVKQPPASTLLRLTVSTPNACVDFDDVKLVVQ